jgi:hypothetical protein
MVLQPEAPKLVFLSTLEVQHPQRSPESSIKCMKNAWSYVIFLSDVRVCIVILARLTVVLKTYSEVCNRYVVFSVVPRVTPWGCSMVKILTNNLSCIGYGFGVGPGVDLRYRGICANINE